jgi:hypothetical protein
MRLARELSKSLFGPLESENGCKINGGSFHTFCGLKTVSIVSLPFIDMFRKNI